MKSSWVTGFKSSRVDLTEILSNHIVRCVAAGSNIDIQHLIDVSSTLYHHSSNPDFCLSTIKPRFNPEHMNRFWIPVAVVNRLVVVDDLELGDWNMVTEEMVAMEIKQAQFYSGFLACICGDSENEIKGQAEVSENEVEGQLSVDKNDDKCRTDADEVKGQPNEDNTEVTVHRATTEDIEVITELCAIYGGTKVLSKINYGIIHQSLHLIISHLLTTQQRRHLVQIAIERFVS